MPLRSSSTDARHSSLRSRRCGDGRTRVPEQLFVAGQDLDVKGMSPGGIHEAAHLPAGQVADMIKHLWTP